MSRWCVRLFVCFGLPPTVTRVGSRCRCGRGAPRRGADVVAASPVPVQMSSGRARSRWGEPSRVPNLECVKVLVQPLDHLYRERLSRRVELVRKQQFGPPLIVRAPQSLHAERVIRKPVLPQRWMYATCCACTSYVASHKTRSCMPSEAATAAQHSSARQRCARWRPWKARLGLLWVLEQGCSHRGVRHGKALDLAHRFEHCLQRPRGTRRYSGH